MRVRLRILAVLSGLALLAAMPLGAEANHSWGAYHWARTANPFTLKVNDSMTSSWDSLLNTAIADWDASVVMNLTKVDSDTSSKTRKRCPAIKGQVRVCNATYGRNGWLGLAQIWASGAHITQATAKMNDTYLASGYSTTAKQQVICQEIGHDWGLDHQDESGADFNTCMDYSSKLDNAHPNAGDYDQLRCIYDPSVNGQTLTSGNHTCTGTGHLDSSTTIAMPAGFLNADVSSAAAWGRLVASSADGAESVFVRDFGNGFRIITHVFWAR